MKKLRLLIAVLFATALFAGCATLDEKQRAWIFQPSDRTWGGGLAAAEGMQDVWIPLPSAKGEKTADNAAARLHGLWLPAS